MLHLSTQEVVLSIEKTPVIKEKHFVYQHYYNFFGNLQELELDIDNLSRGERNRLILSLSWAFRDVWESLYQQINLLFIDELIDAGMDISGVESSMAVLKDMSRTQKKNIFLISHKDELVSRVNSVLKVVKENGFTNYANDVDIIV